MNMYVFRTAKMPTSSRCGTKVARRRAVPWCWPWVMCRTVYAEPATPRASTSICTNRIVRGPARAVEPSTVVTPNRAGWWSRAIGVGLPASVGSAVAAAGDVVEADLVHQGADLASAHGVRRGNGERGFAPGLEVDAHLPHSG